MWAKENWQRYVGVAYTSTASDKTYSEPKISVLINLKLAPLSSTKLTEHVKTGTTI